MASWGRQLCKLVIFCSIVGFVLVLFGEYGLPLIFDYIWRVPASPSKSLEAILAHRIELRNLETELDQILRATSHPVNDHGIPGQIEIAQEYNEYFRVIEDYTKEYGKLELSDIRRFVKSHEKISKKLDEFVERHEELNEERRILLTSIAQRVTDVAESTKSAWTLLKNMDIMAELGIILDLEQQQKDDLDEDKTNAGLALGLDRSANEVKEDNACIEVLQQLLKYMIQADELSKRMVLKVEQLNAQFNDEVYPPITGDSIDVEQELQFFQLESKRLKTEMVDLFKNNRQLIGKTNSFITAATARVKLLTTKVIEKEGDVWMEEMNQALAKIRDKAERCSQLTEKLTSNVNLRIAPDLDREANNDHVEL